MNRSKEINTPEKASDYSDILKKHYKFLNYIITPSMLSREARRIWGNVVVVKGSKDDQFASYSIRTPLSLKKLNEDHPALTETDNYLTIRVNPNYLSNQPSLQIINDLASSYPDIPITPYDLDNPTHSNPYPSREMLKIIIAGEKKREGYRQRHYLSENMKAILAHPILTRNLLQTLKSNNTERKLSDYIPLVYRIRAVNHY
jgi:hypothetical protein